MYTQPIKWFYFAGFKKLLCCSVSLGLAAMAQAGKPANDPALRPCLSLDGEWQFRLDPQREGEAGKWFDASVDFPDKIQVPGNWQAQGFGEPKNHLRNDYQGKAWYRRSFSVPREWSGKRLWLHLDGVSAFGEVYVNGKNVGRVEHFMTPHEFDITTAVTAGSGNLLSCSVDSVSGCHDPHREPVVTPGPVGMFNYWGHWGGLYRSVWLEARPDPQIDCIAVTPDIKNKTAAIRVVVKRSLPGPAWGGTLAVTVTPARGGGPASTARCAVTLSDGQTESAETLVTVAITEMHLWSPETPFLYTVRADILQDGVTMDVKSDRFGMREFAVGPGGTLLLNGAPYFIRGLGDDCVETVTGTLVPDKAVYRERISLSKKYGYNAFRFLAHTPPKEVFDAADELGFLIWAEAPAYWNSWSRINEVIPLYKKMIPQIIKEHRNHPSWYVWSAGNECGETPEWTEYVNAAHAIFKQADPSRFFLASSGIGIAAPSDLNSWHGNFNGTAGGPQVWHEYPGSYAGCLPDLSIADKYTGVIRDSDCVSVHVKEIEDYGLTKRYADIRKKSVEFFYLYLKDIWESNRKSPTLAGYNYWLLTDLPGGVEGDPPNLGMLNMFYEADKFLAPERFLQFNGASVLLINATRDNRIFKAGESKPVTVSLSHYGAKPVENGRLVWKLKRGAALVDTGVIEGVQVDCGQVKEIGQVSLNPDKPVEAAKLTLDVRLESADCRVKNEWDFWVFPARKRNVATSGVVDLTGVSALRERYAAAQILASGTTNGVVVTDMLNTQVVEYVAAGGAAVLLTEADMLQRPLPIAYLPDSLRSVGFIMEPGFVSDHFPNDGFCSDQFFRLFNGSVCALDLTKKGSLERDSFNPVVWGMKADFDPESPAPWPDPRNRTKLYRCGLVSEGRIGKGKVVVCSFGVLDGMTKGYPEAGYLLDCLVDYARSAACNPGGSPLALDHLTQVFKFTAWPAHPEVRNGSFEADALTAYPGYRPLISDWTMSSGGLNDAAGPFMDNGAVPDGAQVFFGQNSGWLSQQVRGFRAAETYTLTFYVNARGYLPPDGPPPRVEAFVNGVSVTPRSDFPCVGGTNAFHEVRADFVSPGSGTFPLRFEFDTNGQADRSVLLDNVTITTLAPEKKE